REKRLQGRPLEREELSHPVDGHWVWPSGARGFRFPGPGEPVARRADGGRAQRVTGTAGRERSPPRRGRRGGRALLPRYAGRPAREPPGRGARTRRWTSLPALQEPGMVILYDLAPPPR